MSLVKYIKEAFKVFLILFIPLFCFAGQKLDIATETKAGNTVLVVNGQQIEFFSSGIYFCGNGGPHGLCSALDYYKGGSQELAAYNDPNGNVVSILPGTLFGGFFRTGHHIYGGYAMVEKIDGYVNANNNNVTAIGATIPCYIVGGHVDFYASSKCQIDICACNNTVNVSSCTSYSYDSAYIYTHGGEIDIYLGSDESKNNLYANCNSVVITKSVLSRGGIIAGGSVNIMHGGYCHKCNLGKVQASSNTVVVDGGKFGGSICGGNIKFYFKDYPHKTCLNCEVRATYNTVTIKGRPEFIPDETTIYGGYIKEAPKVYVPNVDLITGNTLNLETEEPLVVKEVDNFENYNFYNVIGNGPAKLRVVKGMFLYRSNIVAGVCGEIKEGDRVNLIESQGTVSKARSIKLYRNSGLVVYECEREANPNVLALMIRGVKATPQAQKINEVGATGMIIVGQGLGFLSEKGIEEAVGAVKGKRGAEVFVGVGGESSKYKSGIEMSIEGVRAVGGIAKSMKEGEVVIGGYVEHGKGDYKVEEVEGKGMTSYVGVGGLGRVKIGEEVYMDMSMGVGSQGVDFDSKGLNVLTKEDIGYEYRSMYVGGHVGCGYKREVGEKVNIEVAGKVLLMRQEGKEVEMTNGAPVEIEGATSGKIKGVVRAGYKCKEGVEPYVGVGYEHELMGRGKGKVEGVELKEVELKGGMGIGEIGIVGEMGDINIKVSGRGYIGEREGVEGMVKVGYSI